MSEAKSTDPLTPTDQMGGLGGQEFFRELFPWHSILIFLILVGNRV
jgi:hypothetical protein